MLLFYILIKSEASTKEKTNRCNIDKNNIFCQNKDNNNILLFYAIQ